ncbi:uncharacterized protein LOC128882367 [Hylaeus volcanicus]|uniref:uncharacterized protein LOC128882367 n=1 Tax=Hylaeus volcanicus TaxID=313075 RepID=UPI0023B80B74|nr:uncharacterized protein LOC128882367 [Hylaeus volcanicus]
MASTSRSQEHQGRRIFVTRLSPHTKKQHLLKLFGPHGAQHVMIRQRSTGNQAYVTFGSNQAVIQVLALANQTPFVCKNRKLRLLPADSWNDTVAEPGPSRPRPIGEEPNPFPGLHWTSPAERLPEECLALIVSYLTFRDRARLEIVSQRWRLSSIASCRDIKCLSTGDWRWGEWSPIITSEAFRWIILRAGPFCRSLTVRDEDAAAELRSSVTAISTKHCKYLERLDITGVTIRPSVFRELSEGVSSLTALLVGQCHGPVDPGLGEVLEKNRNLRELSLEANGVTGKALLLTTGELKNIRVTRCRKLMPSIFSDFMSKQRHLEHIEMSHCSTTVVTEALSAAVKNTSLHTTLHTVRIHACFDVLPSNKESDEDHEMGEPEVGDFLEMEVVDVDLGEGISFPQAFQTMTDLKITFCGWVNAGFVRDIGRYMRGLMHLDISGNSNVRGQFALEPLEGLEHCHTLAMTNLFPDVGGLFLRTLPRLQHLDARDSWGVTDEDICGLLGACTTLRYLNVEGCRQLTRAVVDCAYRSIPSRETTLTLLLGETRAVRFRRDRRNMYLTIHYDRQTPRRT